MDRIIYLFTLLFCICHINAQKPWLPYEVNGKWGFKDAGSRTVIEPIYLEVGKPSEGLIAARTQIGFGYINDQNQFLIAPKYDYAYPFKSGYALVYFQAKPYLINTKGQVLFEHSFVHLKKRGTQVIVTTQRAQKGMVDMSGKLVLDTIYHDIKIWEDSIIVARLDGDHILMDQHGQVIRHLSSAQAEEKFNDGLLFSHSYERGGKWVKSILNARGQECISKDAELHQLGYANYFFSDSMLIAQVPAGGKKSQFPYNSKGQALLVYDYKGKLVFQDSVKVINVHQFYKDTAFIQAYFPDGEGYFLERWMMINKKGEGKFIYAPIDLSDPEVDNFWGVSNALNPSEMLSSPFEVADGKELFPSLAKRYPVWSKTLAGMHRFSTTNGVQLILDSVNTSSKNLRLFLINQSKDTLLLLMRGRTIASLNLQALDQHGVWRNLIYEPPPVCGGDFFQSHLHARHYWDGVLPNFQQGNFSTKLRVQLTYNIKGDDQDRYIYSQVFNGKLNPGQFWRNGVLDSINRECWVYESWANLY